LEIEAETHAGEEAKQSLYEYYSGRRIAMKTEKKIMT